MRTPRHHDAGRPDREGGRPGGTRAAFTLIELLVVIGIIALLLGLMVPYLMKAKNLAGEKTCAANMRGANIAMKLYAEENAEHYPVEPTEHNPHPGLVSVLGKYNSGIIDAMYCPQARYLEPYAQDPTYTPMGDTDSVIDTPENRKAGRVSYVYWSFQANKVKPGGTPGSSKDCWREPTGFLPRALTASGLKFDPAFVAAVLARGPQDTMRVKYQDCITAPPGQIWVISDFFRQGAPFPHAREHARGLNIGYHDGHVELLIGQPRANYR